MYLSYIIENWKKVEANYKRCVGSSGAKNEKEGRF